MQHERHFRRWPRKQDWLDQVFQCRAAETGGVIRRQVRDVESEVGVAALVAEVRRRNFRLIRTRAHFVIVCDSGPVDVVV
jgi:hypothetical protein